MKVLLVDNYDSFTFNLLHYLQNAGAEVVVKRNDELEKAEMNLVDFDAAVLSPGPGRPDEWPGLMEFVGINLGKKPILGICLGMQAIGLFSGWKLGKAMVPVHGKPSEIEHNQRGIFKDIPNPMSAGRYHSLVIEKPILTDLMVEAESGGEVMAISGGGELIWGVQFHPESILTPEGQKLIQNWVEMIAGA